MSNLSLLSCDDTRVIGNVPKSCPCFVRGVDLFCFFIVTSRCFETPSNILLLREILPIFVPFFFVLLVSLFSFLWLGCKSGMVSDFGMRGGEVRLPRKSQTIVTKEKMKINLCCHFMESLYNVTLCCHSMVSLYVPSEPVCDGLPKRMLCHHGPLKSAR